MAEIRAIHTDSRGTYGSRRVTHELRRRGWRVNHKRVERLMADHGIVGHRPRRRRGLTKPDAAAPPAPDLLGRLFDPDRIDVAWCGDLTFIPTDEGWPYLASVLDLASRHLLGWSMGERHDAGLVGTRSRPPWPPVVVTGWTPPSFTPTAAARADPTGRRNTLTVRGCDGNAQASTGRPCWAAADAVTRPSAGRATRAHAAVLGRGRPWVVERGGRCRRRCVACGRSPLVP
jgi:hypothetical protein